MARSRMQGMAIRGIVGCVPSRVIDNDVTSYPWFSASEIRKVGGMAGIKTRRHADPDVCTSDLCCAAAQSLLDRLEWAPESIDALLLVTQTPDYVMPSTSCLLQQRLGLSSECAAFDVGLGCSAYAYGLWIANALLCTGARRILLLAGETPSKLVNPKDRATALLFGDAGTATALEYSDDPSLQAHYILRTDGSGGDALVVRGGMFRQRDAGRDDCFLKMDGMALFEFTRRQLPSLIDELLSFEKATSRDYAYFVFHQANEYMIRFLAGKAKISNEQLPLVLDRFGNTGAASVPLTLAVAGAPKAVQSNYRVMLLGFGVGLSWGGVSLTMRHDCVLHYLDYVA